jgi:hypothetical protein
MLFILAQVLLAAFALTLWHCVLGNALSLDTHYRSGLGITVIGLAYLTGHAMYLSAVKQLAEPAAEVGSINSITVDERSETDTKKPASKQEIRKSKPGSTRVNIEIKSIIVKIIPNEYLDESPWAALAVTGGGGQGSTPAAVAAGSAEIRIVQPGTALGVRAAVETMPRVMVASASAGGGAPVAADSTYPDARVLSRNNQQSNRAGPPPRTLSEAQIQNAIGLLKTRPKQDVLIITMKGRGDGPQVAEQLIDVFSSAEWEVFAETSEAKPKR